MNSTLQQTAEFRKMYPEDLDHVILIEREIFLFPGHWEILPIQSRQVMCQVLEQADVLFGYGIMMMSPEEAHILTIGIAADWQKKVGVKSCSSILFSMPEEKMQNRYSWMYENLITVPHSSINKWVSSTLQHAKVITRQCADVKMRLSCS